MSSKLTILAALICITTFRTCPVAAADAGVDFRRDIRPLLSDRCFHCHGPAEQHADLRLDSREGAVEAAVTPGDADASELIARVSARGELQMPPAGSGKAPLTDEQIDLLRRWIDSGAEYQRHWSFTPLTKPTPPVDNRFENPVDRFVSRRLAQAGLSLQPVANPYTLARRVTLDLTGLPPSPKETRAFLSDESAEAYDRLVRRLLDSPRYGEHMARFWLDAARYGDTHGLHLDNYREIWPYRDWVVNAFNGNQRFDDFIVEQLAGDLLPKPTEEQLIATGFLRCNVTTNEGGSIKQEVYTRNVMDRVDTYGTVFLGLTVGCAKCHDHKFDPIKMEDYYSLFAFFNGLDGDPMDQNTKDHAPAMKVTPQSVADRVTELDAFLQSLNAQLTTPGGIQEAERSRLRLLAKQSSKRREELLAGTSTLIYRERSDPPAAYVLLRGEYDKPGKQAPRRVPSFLPSMPEGLPRDRMGLAMWTVSRDNPLTARVVVNRLWQQLMGVGLVKTSEDLGSQSEPPTHPELLDWLAADFVESGWDIKRLLKLLVTSQTYQQYSVADERIRRLDPDNRLLSRGPRLRLDAEVVRDQSLALGGLLVNRLGGPPVRPPQPLGLWNAVAYSTSNTSRFEADIDRNGLHRRSLYTFHKRTAPPPQLTILDGPSRESCIVRRERTNTPLQALMLMNDPQFVEAARALAQRSLRDASADEQARARLMLETATGRPAAQEEATQLAEWVCTERNRFRREPDEAKKLLGLGVESVDDQYTPCELAAWTMAANLVLNLDEVLTKN